MTSPAGSSSLAEDEGFGLQATGFRRRCRSPKPEVWRPRRGLSQLRAMPDAHRDPPQHPEVTPAVLVPEAHQVEEGAPAARLDRLVPPVAVLDAERPPRMVEEAPEDGEGGLPRALPQGDCPKR